MSGPHPGDTRPSLLSVSRPTYRTGLTPPTVSLPLPIPQTRGEALPSEQSQRGPSPVPSSLQRSLIFTDMPLSSSPPSHVQTRPIPSPSNPSPLVSSSSQTAQLHLSTTPESLGSLPTSSPQPDGSESSLPPLILRASSSSSNEASLLLLEQVHITSPPTPDDASRHPRVGSTSTGSGHTNRDRSTSLLDAAARDPEPLLRRAANGTVEAGTLEGLVDRLVKETHDSAKDKDVRRVFITTYRLFATGEDVFGILKRHFDEMGDPLRFSYARGSIRYS